MPPNWPNADCGGAAAGAEVENKERMSCLTSFLCAGAAAGGVGLWKSRLNRSLAGATGAGAGAVACCWGGAIGAA